VTDNSPLTPQAVNHLLNPDSWQGLYLENEKEFRLMTQRSKLSEASDETIAAALQQGSLELFPGSQDWYILRNPEWIQRLQSHYRLAALEVMQPLLESPLHWHRETWAISEGAGESMAEGVAINRYHLPNYAESLLCSAGMVTYFSQNTITLTDPAITRPVCHHLKLQHDVGLTMLEAYDEGWRITPQGELRFSAADAAGVPRSREIYEASLSAIHQMLDYNRPPRYRSPPFTPESFEPELDDETRQRIIHGIQQRAEEAITTLLATARPRVGTDAARPELRVLRTRNADPALLHRLEQAGYIEGRGEDLPPLLLNDALAERLAALQAVKGQDGSAHGGGVAR
jgi:hypothetical protein